MHINTLIIIAMVVIPLSVVLRAAYRSTTIYDCTMAEYRRKIGFTGYPHDGSIEYVLTNTQIKALTKPILFDQDGYMNNTNKENN